MTHTFVTVNYTQVVAGSNTAYFVVKFCLFLIVLQSSKFVETNDCILLIVFQKLG